MVLGRRFQGAGIAFLLISRTSAKQNWQRFLKEVKIGVGRTEERPAKPEKRKTKEKRSTRERRAAKKAGTALFQVDITIGDFVQFGRVSSYIREAILNDLARIRRRREDRRRLRRRNRLFLEEGERLGNIVDASLNAGAVVGRAGARVERTERFEVFGENRRVTGVNFRGGRVRRNGRFERLDLLEQRGRYTPKCVLRLADRAVFEDKFRDAETRDDRANAADDSRDKRD